MLSSITPLGERGRGQRWWLTVTAYIIGSAVGGAALGTLLGVVGGLVRLDALATTATAALVGVAGIAALLFDLPLGLRLPRYGRQVNEDWMPAYRGWVYGLGFGLQLGAGLATIVTAGLVYVVFLTAFLSGSAVVGLVLGATFGVVRGLPILAGARVQTADELLAFHRGLQAAAPVARAATVVGDVAVVAGAVVALFAA